MRGSAPESTPDARPRAPPAAHVAARARAHTRARTWAHLRARTWAHPRVRPWARPRARTWARTWARPSVRAWVHPRAHARAHPRAQPPQRACDGGLYPQRGVIGKSQPPFRRMRVAAVCRVLIIKPVPALSLRRGDELHPPAHAPQRRTSTAARRTRDVEAAAAHPGQHRLLHLASPAVGRRLPAVRPPAASHVRRRDHAAPRSGGRAGGAACARARPRARVSHARSARGARPRGNYGPRVLARSGCASLGAPPRTVHARHRWPRAGSIWAG
eukprot:3016982-Pleurochrysis_carterae.AAC.2